MLALANYGSSDEEDNISDEEEAIARPVSLENGVNSQVFNDQDSFLEKSTKIKLPEPKSSTTVQTSIPEEDDDEFLHKKAVPETAPPPKAKQKVKIMIPRLSDFKDDDDEDEKPKYTGPSAINRRTGLLGMLPKPAHSFTAVPKLPEPLSSSSTTTSASLPSATSSKPTTSTSTTKKIGLIPYTLMEHNKKTESSKKPGKRKGKESDESSDDDDLSKPFFSFNTNDDLPQVNEDEIKAMVERETHRIELRKMQADSSNQIDTQEPDYSQQEQDQQQMSDFDQEAMKALVGGSRAKRAKMEGIQIMDLTDHDVLPDKDDWKRKVLAGETSYMATGQIDEKGPALAKRKHQISYLSMRAEKNISELEAMWAANRQSNREGRSKYGF